MKVFVLILQKPLRVKTYTSLAALYNDNKNALSISKSTLDHYDFDRFNYVSSRVIIAKTEAQSTGNVKKRLQSHNSTLEDSIQSPK